MKNSLILILILFTTFFIFSPLIQYEFTNWDDTSHVTENELVRRLNFSNIKKIFFSTINDTYIPLTILTFAIEYHFFGYNAAVFHFNNLLLHLAVVALVFYFAKQLGLNLAARSLAALLFALHPMHVESVAWVTERKDVLYAFFYMLALCCYAGYVQTNQRGFYLLSLSMGLLSILSKPMALSLPLILFLYDWFNQRGWSKKVVFEKLPYFVYILPISWVTYSFHSRIPVTDFGGAILVWVWTFSFYLQKFFFPINLSPLYALPEPVSIVNKDYLLAIVISLGAIFLVVRLRKSPLFLFAFFFFFLSVFFLMRYDKGVDLSIVADRFMYLPSVGFCLLLGYSAQRIKERLLASNKFYSPIWVLWITGILLALSLLTRSQMKVWEDSLVLWTTIIDKGVKHPVVFNNRGEVYAKKKEFDPALEDFNKALSLNPLHASAYNNRAQVYRWQGKYDLALKDYEIALRLKPQYIIYFNRAALWGELEREDFSLQDFQRALELKPDFKEAYNNIGSIYIHQKKWGLALENLNKALGIDPLFTKSLTNRAIVYRFSEEYTLALRDLNQALTLDPKNALGYYHRSLTFAALKDYKKALEDALKAKSSGKEGMEKYLKKLTSLLEESYD